MQLIPANSRINIAKQDYFQYKNGIASRKLKGTPKFSIAARFVQSSQNKLRHSSRATVPYLNDDHQSAVAAYGE
jgi:hypothetical protein